MELTLTKKELKTIQDCLNETNNRLKKQLSHHFDIEYKRQQLRVDTALDKVSRMIGGTV